jgi:hypothetical protein
MEEWPMRNAKNTIAESSKANPVEEIRPEQATKKEDLRVRTGLKAGGFWYR